MDDVVDAVHGPVEAVPVADVADEPAQAVVVVEQLAALVLLELVAAEDDDALGVVVAQELGDERLAEGAGAPGDEDGGAGEDGWTGSGMACHDVTTPRPRSRMRVVVVIQARMGSTRLPGKVLADLGGIPVLEWVVRACRARPQGRRRGRRHDHRRRSTTPSPRSRRRLGVAGGPRAARTTCCPAIVQALDEHPADAVVRITADCPFTDPASSTPSSRRGRPTPTLDYVSTVLVRTLPHGLDVELVTAGALRRVDAARDGPPPGPRHLRHLHRPGRLPRHGAVLRPRRDRPAGHPRHRRRTSRPSGRSSRRAGPRRGRRAPSSSPCCGPGPTSSRSTPQSAEDAGRGLMRVLLRCDGGPQHRCRPRRAVPRPRRGGGRPRAHGRAPRPGRGNPARVAGRTVSGPGLTLLGPEAEGAPLAEVALGHDVVHVDHYELGAEVLDDVDAAARLRRRGPAPALGHGRRRVRGPAR